MTIAEQINQLDKQIDAIHEKYSRESAEYTAILDLNTALFRAIRKPGDATADAVKHFIADHADNPALHADMIAISKLFVSMVELTVAKVKGETPHAG